MVVFLHRKVCSLPNNRHFTFQNTKSSLALTFVPLASNCVCICPMGQQGSILIPLAPYRARRRLRKGTTDLIFPDKCNSLFKHRHYQEERMTGTGFSLLDCLQRDVLDVSELTKPSPAAPPACNKNYPEPDLPLATGRSHRQH